MERFRDHGLETVGLAGYETPRMLVPWNEAVLKGFGIHAGSMGTISGDAVPHLMMEYDETDEIAGLGMVRTKMLELSPTDYNHIRMTGHPRDGAAALSDEGDVYQYSYDPISGLGFFKKIWSGVKKVGKKIVGGVKKVGKAVYEGGKRLVKGVVSTAKSIISKLPGGKYLVKLYDKVHKTAMKLVRPLTKFVGKYASKLAPIAALIPGYGPAIAGALYTAGKVAKILQKTGVTQDPKTGKPKFKSGAQAKRFKKELGKAAKEEKKRQEREKKKKKQAKKRRAKKREKRKEKRAERRQRREERQMEARIIKRLQQQGMFRRPMERPAQPGGPARLIRAGTAEHAMELRGLGLDIDDVL